MNSKTILITGATDGIGKQSALELAAKGHLVLVHGRNAERAETAVREIRDAVKNAQVEPVVADFSSLAAVRDLAASLNRTHPHIDILINNAGVFLQTRTLTADGYEATFAINYLAHFLLTHLLLDTLKANAPARIVHVSSGTHRSGHIEFDNLQGERKYSPYDAYANTKLANVLFAYALAERLGGTGVTSNALHPGVIRTKLLHAGWGGGGADLRRGAETIVYVATAKELETVTGRFFDNRRESVSSVTSHDPALQRRLWELSTQLVGL